MKLDARRVDAFLLDPGACRLVLLFGDDAGLMRERVRRLTRTVAGALDDPFRVVDLERDGAGRIAAEMASLPLTGGRRVVRVREASDAMAAVVQAVLASRAPGLLIMEGGGLAGRSKLRTLAEAAADAVAIGCYPRDGAALANDIRAGLAAHRVTIDAEALRWLTGRLGADQAVTAAEIDKLALYVGDGGGVDVAAAEACVGDLAGLSLDDALFAATAGDVAATDRSLEIALSEGTAAVGVVRAALLHVQRLHRASLAMVDGATAEAAAKSARPPVFYRREPAFLQALALWSDRALDAASARLSDADRSCKRTGAPAEAICRSVVLGLSQRAFAQRALGQRAPAGRAR